jgi:hypothetical protein
MKKSTPAAALIVALTTCCAAAAPALSWNQIKDKHFIVFYTESRDEFAGKILEKSEGYYRSIPRKLGITRHSDFWTWDNRVKIRIYPDRKTFLEKTKRRPWVRAIANHKTREITSYQGHEKRPFADTTLPHELAHLVLRDFMGFENKAIPLWLDEGVAQIVEKGRSDQAKRKARELLRANQLMSVGTLTKLDTRRVRHRLVVVAFYAEACALVDYMIEEHGAEKFTRFCRQLRDGKKLNAALKAAYSTTISSVDKLDSAWKAHLKK